MAQPFFCHHLCLHCCFQAQQRPWLTHASEETQHLRSTSHSTSLMLPGSLDLWHSSSDLYHLITTYAPSQTALACGLFPFWFKHTQMLAVHSTVRLFLINVLDLPRNHCLSPAHHAFGSCHLGFGSYVSDTGIVLNHHDICSSQFFPSALNFQKSLIN